MAETAPGSNRLAVERAVAELIQALGLNAATEPELANTPERVADLYAEILAGLDPARAPQLATFAHPGGDDVVILRGISFHSLCVHHFLPFFGRVDIAYLPADRLLGVSGLARLVEHYARRPQLQERMTAQIADHLERVAEPRGLKVVCTARHLCMEMRGIRRRAVMETHVARGGLAGSAASGLDLGGRGTRRTSR